MTYYCDKLRHLVCVPYSVENLHKMARDLGIKRCWFHRDHYDMPKRRIAEISARCEIVHPTRILSIIRSTMKRHCVEIQIEQLVACVYIEAKELKVISHERVIADGVVIDLPGNIRAGKLKVEDIRPHRPITEPVISIDRQSKKYAVFNNGIELVRDFRSYDDEQEAIDEAMAWVAQYSAKVPKVVYPNVTKIRVS